MQDRWSGRGERVDAFHGGRKTWPRRKICRLQALTSFIFPATKKPYGGSSREEKLYDMLEKPVLAT